MGKSTLTRSLIASFEADQRKGEKIAHYCADNRGAEIPKTSTTVLAILLKMLAGMLFRETSREYREKLQSISVELLGSGDRLSASRMRYLFSKIRHSLKSDDTLFLFLDGIDDFEQGQSQPALLHELIEQLSRCDSRHRVKCFVSARSTSSMRKALGHALIVDLDTEPSAQGNLETYLLHVCRESPFPGVSTQSWGNCMYDTLVKSKGNFLWANLAIRSSLLSRNLSRLEDILQSPSTRNISDLYSYMLDKVAENKRRAVLLMLRWVAYAARPLRRSELLDALHSQLDIKMTTGDICEISDGLLTTNNSVLQEVSFVHLTVREYLESESGDKCQAISDETNEMITRTCWRALSPQLLLESLELHLHPAKLEPVIDPQPALQSYALRHWKFHYSKAERGSRQLPGLLHSFLEQSLRDPRSARLLAHGGQDLNRLSQNQAQEQQIHTKLSSTNLVNTALMIGARFGFLKLAKLELEMGAVVNSKFGPYNHTPLALAASAGHLQTVELLLRHGADVNMPSGNGNTPLIYAIANGHIEIVELLLAHGTPILGNYSCEASNNTISESAKQELKLEVALSDACSSCGEAQAEFVVSIKQTVLQTVPRH